MKISTSEKSRNILKTAPVISTLLIQYTNISLMQRVCMKHMVAKEDIITRRKEIMPDL